MRGETSEAIAPPPPPPLPNDICFVDYKDESQIEQVMHLVGQDLSEPYSIFTYRYFVYRYPELCILAVNKQDGTPIGCVVGKMDDDNNNVVVVGYIGMLAIQAKYRRRGIGKALVHEVLGRMKRVPGCTSVTLETEVSNSSALKLYQESFGFVREELLVRYYLNWGDAYRLRLWF